MAFLFLGFPSAWDKVFALLTGLLIIVIAFRSGSMNAESKSNSKNGSVAGVPYVEHKTIVKNPQTSFSSVDVETPIPNSGNDFIKTDSTIS